MTQTMTAPKATMIGEQIVRTVKVNRNRTLKEALDATGCTQYTDRKVVDNMLKCEGGEAEVVFFKPDLSKYNGLISDDDLEKEFKLRGLKPAGPVLVAAVNEADPEFSGKIPHITHWKNTASKWCFVSFHRWFPEHRVRVYCEDNESEFDWGDFWWFAGVRLPAQTGK